MYHASAIFNNGAINANMQLHFYLEFLRAWKGAWDDVITVLVMVRMNRIYVYMYNPA